MKGVKILIGMRTQVSMRNLRISKFGLGLGKSVFSIEKSWQYFFFRTFLQVRVEGGT